MKLLPNIVFSRFIEDTARVLYACLCKGARQKPMVLATGIKDLKLYPFLAPFVNRKNDRTSNPIIPVRAWAGSYGELRLPYFRYEVYMQVYYELSIDEKFYYERIIYNGKKYILQLPLKEADESMVTWLRAKSPRKFFDEVDATEFKKELKNYKKL